MHGSFKAFYLIGIQIKMTQVFPILTVCDSMMSLQGVISHIFHDAS